MDERGQISAELLIVLAAMAALALFLVSQLQSGAEKMGGAYEERIENLEEELKKLESGGGS